MKEVNNATVYTEGGYATKILQEVVYLIKKTVLENLHISFSLFDFLYVISDRQNNI